MIKFLIGYAIVTVIGLVWMAYEVKIAPIVEDDLTEPIDIDFDMTMEDDEYFI